MFNCTMLVVSSPNNHIIPLKIAVTVQFPYVEHKMKALRHIIDSCEEDETLQQFLIYAAVKETRSMQCGVKCNRLPAYVKRFNSKHCVPCRLY